MNTREGSDRCKVQRMIDTHGLSGSNERMLEWWTGDGDTLSIRKITREFNQELLSRELRRQGTSPLDSEVSNLYRLLSADDEDVSRGMRIQTRNRLEQQGVDVDALLEDFVSYQSIYRHLNDCLDADYASETPPVEERRERAKDRILSLKNRSKAVTADTVAQLVDSSALALEEFDVFVDISMTCNECQRQYTVAEVLENGGCFCQNPSL